MQKKMNNRGGEYTAPALEVLDVTVENGFAASVEFGDYGSAGQGGSYDEYEGDDL